VTKKRHRDSDRPEIDFSLTHGARGLDYPREDLGHLAE